MSTIRTYRRESILVVAIDRPEVRNAVNPVTAAALAQAFGAFDADDSVAILTGTGGTFCAGYDLKSHAAGRSAPLSEEGDGPMGPTRMLLCKPVITAIEGHAVAGGLDLALRCDLRVAAEDRGQVSPDHIRFVRPGSHIALEKAGSGWRGLYAKWFRAHPRIKNDNEVVEADFAKYNVVLFGDPRSNRWIARMKLPVGWTRDTVTLGACHALEISPC